MGEDRAIYQRGDLPMGCRGGEQLLVGNLSKLASLLDTLTLTL